MTMSLKQKILLALAITATLFAIAYVGGRSAYLASAEPSFFNRFRTNDSQSTLAYMTPGRGTTTLAVTNGSDTSYDYATVLLEVTATSTGVVGPVTLKARVEISDDNSTWYPVAISTVSPYGLATTTPLTTDPYNDLSLKLSTSTTPAGDFGGSGTATKIYHSFQIPTPVKHTRVIFTNPAAGGNYGVWAQIITRKQSN